MVEEEQLAGFDALGETLRNRDYPDMRLHTETLAGEKHRAGVIAQAFVRRAGAVFRLQPAGEHSCAAIAQGRCHCEWLAMPT